MFNILTNYKIKISNASTMFIELACIYLINLGYNYYDNELYAIDPTE